MIQTGMQLSDDAGEDIGRQLDVVGSALRFVEIAQQDLPVALIAEAFDDRRDVIDEPRAVRAVLEREILESQLEVREIALAHRPQVGMMDRSPNQRSSTRISNECGPRAWNAPAATRHAFPASSAIGPDQRPGRRCGASIR